MGRTLNNWTVLSMTAGIRILDDPIQALLVWNGPCSRRQLWRREQQHHRSGSSCTLIYQEYIRIWLRFSCTSRSGFRASRIGCTNILWFAASWKRHEERQGTVCIIHANTASCWKYFGVLCLWQRGLQLLCSSCKCSKCMSIYFRLTTATFLLRYHACPQSWWSSKCSLIWVLVKTCVLTMRRFIGPILCCSKAF